MMKETRIMPLLARWMLIPALLAPAVPAAAAPEPSTRLVECQSGDCLLVTGRRQDRDSAVAINGRAVPVQGAHRWEALLPVETLRAWSAPNARTVTVLVEGAEAEARLPIGMFLQSGALTMLVVKAQ